MKKINELDAKTLITYAQKKIKITDLKTNMKNIRKEIDSLLLECEYIENEGKLPVINFCADDIPF